jgi:hypothetical protein
MKLLETQRAGIKRVYALVNSVKHLLKRLVTRLPKICKSILFMRFRVLWDEVDSIPLMQNVHYISLELKLLGLLPCKVLVGEVTVLGGLEIDGVDEVEFLDDDTGAEIEVLVDDFDELSGRLVRGAVGLDEHGEGLGDTDGVGKLDERAAGELGVHERLGDPARKVGGGTIDLGVVLSGESTTTVGTPATVGVDDDLTASETGVTLGTTDDEETGGLDLRLLVCI